MIFKFQVTSFRNQYESPSGKKLCVFTVSVNKLPKEWNEWREVNVRDANKRGDVFNAIKHTLLNEPEEMIFRNLGLTILTPDIEFDNKTNEVSIVFLEKKSHGIANGGHTFSAIQEAIEEKGEINAQVKVECIVGDLSIDERVSVVDGRNRSRAAQPHSLENLRESYKEIEKNLANPRYKDRIAYSEYELDSQNKRKDISIREILSYVYCLDSFDKNSHPIQAYSAKGSVVDYYADEENREILKKASKLLPEILELRDTIYKEFPDAYNSFGWKFGGLETKGVKKLPEPDALRFKEDFTEYNYPDSFLYPILAAFRKYIDHEKEWKWKNNENPFKIWENRKGDIAAAMKDAIDNAGNANQLGKASITWRVCYDAL